MVGHLLFLIIMIVFLYVISKIHKTDKQLEQEARELPPFTQEDAKKYYDNFY